MPKDLQLNIGRAKRPGGTKGGLGGLGYGRGVEKEEGTLSGLE